MEQPSFFDQIASTVAQDWLTLLLAFLAGVVPVLVWLWFWEHEDKHPEPKKLIFASFLGGMAAVVIALPLEQRISAWLDIYKNLEGVIWAWAIVEEGLKFLFAYVIALRRLENDEPIDSMMYMITVALGFAALENAFFIWNPLSNGSAMDALVTGNARFIGATLLHTVASGVIGLFLALSFYRDRRAKWLFGVLGVAFAIVLHALFNLSIISFNGGDAIIPFYAVWIAVVGTLLAFEKVKQIKQPTS